MRGSTARYSPSQSWVLEGPPNPMGRVRSGGSSKWHNVWLPDYWEQPEESREDSQSSSSGLPVPSPADRTEGHHAMHCLLVRHCHETSFLLPNLRNTGLANGNTEKHSSSFKLRTAGVVFQKLLAVPP